MAQSTTKKGRFTLPAQSGMESIIPHLAERWGADALRDSDGTELSEELLALDFDIYTTLCLIREENDWAREHPEYYQQMYLTTKPKTAFSRILDISLMEGYYREQLALDLRHDPMQWWEVIDRTTGEIVSAADYELDAAAEILTIKNAAKWHRYTVSFLVYQIWEPVSMYNHRVNNWKEPHKPPLDPRHPEVRKRLLNHLENWLCQHPRTKVVRFTTFFYNFDLIYNQDGKERQVDWFGYLGSVSPLAMEEFQKTRGYRLRAEDFIDNGYYNSPFRNPSKVFLDYMDFTQRFVSELAAECVKLVHAAGKKAIMFLGDHWSGTEPYGNYFQSIGLDAVVGAAGDGVTLRMISDIPVKETEARFYPYLFPDVFHEGGDPAGEAQRVWVQSRRAILRKPVDRIGYGGYLSLAVKFPDFVDTVEQICSEFRQLHDRTRGEAAMTAPFKVGVLNSWGRVRTWQTHQIAHSLWNQRCYSYLGLLESLSGMEFEVEFISFDDIEKNGIDREIGILLNAGDGGTSFSGGAHWRNERITSIIREWVHGGGGFIGVGEPTAAEHQGAYFQLADVLGVQREIGYSLSCNKPRHTIMDKHFITSELGEHSPDFGEGMNSVYAGMDDVQILAVRSGSCALTVHPYGNGRSVYIAGLPFNPHNSRLLKRAIYWAADREDEMLKLNSTNPYVEAAFYRKNAVAAVINNDASSQTAKITDFNGTQIEVSLMPYEMKWVELS